jgi:hypothetical protein
MRLRRTALLTALLTPALLLGTASLSLASSAGPARHLVAVSSPARVLPSWARLRDAAGRTNGCHVFVPRFLPVPQQGVMTIEMRDRESCPKGADIHWMALSGAVYQVLPDGSRAVVYPRGLSWAIASPPPTLITDPGVGAAYLDCSYFGLSGQVTLIFNAKLRAWSVQHDPGKVYHAVVERQETVNCTL